MPAINSEGVVTLPTGCSVRKKKATNPPKRPTSPSQFSEGPSPMVPIPFAVAAAPPGVHIMPSRKCDLLVGRAQHVKCQQSAVQGFSLYQLDALQAKKGSKPPKASNLSLTVLRVPVPNGPNGVLQWLRRPLGYTQCPHLNVTSPLAEHNTSNAISQQCRGFHSTNWMQCKQKKAINPPKRPTGPSQFSECPSPMVPIPFAVAAAPPRVHRKASYIHELLVGRAHYVNCHQSAVQGFSVLPDWLVVLKNTVKILFLRCC